MRRSHWLRLGIGGLLTLCAAALWVVYWAPLYLLMPHVPRNTDALFGEGPASLAHRGASGQAPENTLAAFRTARKLGAWIELDVTLCATGEVVVIHDDTVDRTTDGQGRVADLPIQELRRLDAGSWYGGRFTHEKIPTLSEVFAVIGPDTPIDIELKTDDDPESLPRAVAVAIERAKRVDSVFVSSFNPFMLEQLRLTNPAILRGQLVGSFEGANLTFYEKRALQNLAFTSRAQPDIVLWEHTILNKRLVERLHRQGYRVLTWTVNEPEDITRVTSWHVDGILTDFPERLP